MLLLTLADVDKEEVDGGGKEFNGEQASKQASKRAGHGPCIR